VSAKVKPAGFLTQDVKYIDRPSEKGIELLSEVHYETIVDGVLTTIIIPVGFKCDLYSVPSGLQWVYNDLDRDNRPAILHDWLYLTQLYSRPKADFFLKEAMLHCKYSKVNAEVKYRSVRWFGHADWDKPSRVFKATQAQISFLKEFGKELLPYGSKLTKEANLWYLQNH
jgi:hypothetical protein